MVNITLIAPRDYYGAMVDIIKDRRGEDIQVQYLEDGNVLILSRVPWQEVVCDMNDHVKNGSSGYATFNYTEAGYQKADLVKVKTILKSTTSGNK